MDLAQDKRAQARAGETMRSAQIRAESYREEDNSVEVVFSAGARVLKYDWERDEVYLEDLPLAGMRFDKLNAGAHVLDSHSTHSVRDILGRVLPGSGRIDGDEAVARVALSRDPAKAGIVADIRAGIIGLWSYGYSRDGAYEESRDEETGLSIRTWAQHTPNEISAVPVPADFGTGTRAQQPVRPAQEEEDPMAEEKKAAPVVEPADNTEILNAARAEGARAEAQRQTEIRGIADKLGLADEDIRAHLADPACTIEAFRAVAIDLVAERADKTPTHPQHSGIQAGRQDETGTRVQAISEALEVRMGVRKESELSAPARDLRGASLLDIGAARLQMAGVNTRGRSRIELAEMVLHSGTRAGAHTTSDFPYLTANVLNKVLMAEREMIPEYRWFEQIAARNDFSDFKTRSYVKLDGMGQLPVVPEGAEYVSLTMDEGRETMVAVKRGAEFPLTMELMVNDDLGGFLRLVRKFARSAMLTESAVAAALLSTQTMADGELVCSSAHSNLSTSGGAPDVDKLAELDGFLRDQTDGNGEVIGLPGRFLLLPSTWRKATEQLFSPQYRPTAATSALTVDIPAERRIYIPSLAGTNPYYMATGDRSAMEYGYLQGDGGPVVTSYQKETSDSLVYHGRLVFGAGIIDEKAFACNPGA